MRPERRLKPGVDGGLRAASWSARLRARRPRRLHREADLNEADAADAYACAFIGIDRCTRHRINCDKVRSQGGLCDPSTKADARGTRASKLLTQHDALLSARR